MQLRCVERLGDEVVRPGVDALQLVLFVPLRGDDHDGDESRRRVFLQLPADLEAVALRRHQVDQHQVWRMRRAGAQHRVGRLHDGDAVPFTREEALQESRARFIVIGNEDRRRRIHNRPDDARQRPR